MQFIAGKKAKFLLENKNAMLIDVRTPVIFNQGTIDGAKNLPLRNLVNELLVLSRKKLVPLIVFGTDETDKDVLMAVKYAENYGFDIYVLKDMSHWDTE